MGSSKQSRSATATKNLTGKVVNPPLKLTTATRTSSRTRNSVTPKRIGVKRISDGAASGDDHVSEVSEQDIDEANDKST